MAAHSSTLAWKMPWTEEPGRLQSMVAKSRARLSNFTFFLSLVIKTDLLGNHGMDRGGSCYSSKE